MSLDYLNEAFKSLNMLQEKEFGLNTDDMDDLRLFKKDDSEDVTRIIDTDAKSDEEIKKSYLGKIIINCNVCHSNIFKDDEDITIDEDGTVNSEDICPYCGEDAGFTIIGKICPVDKEEDNKETAVATGETEKQQETADNDRDEEKSEITEDIDAIKVETDDNCIQIKTDDDTLHICLTKEEDQEENKVEVDSTENDGKDEDTSNEVFPETENITETSDETVKPLEDEEKDEIIDLTSEPDDIDIEDISETKTNEVVEKYLKNIYENVSSFKLSNAKMTDSNIILEGVIKFNSGKETKTGFIFNPDSISSTNKVRFVGMNEHFSSSPKAFTLVGIVEGKEFIPQSLTYKYSVLTEGKTQVVQGRAVV